MINKQNHIELSQTIIIDKKGSHENTVKAAAIASYETYKQQFNTNNKQLWLNWLENIHTKKVKRANLTQIQKIASNHKTTIITINDSSATATLPMLKEEEPKEIKKLQMNNTQLPHLNQKPNIILTEQEILALKNNLIIINNDLNMSTGKQCAQAAHMYWHMQQNLLSKTSTNFNKKINPEQTHQLNHPITNFNIVWADNKTFQNLKNHERYTHQITDAAKTELSQPTSTTILLKEKLKL